MAQDALAAAANILQKDQDCFNKSLESVWSQAGEDISLERTCQLQMSP